MLDFLRSLWYKIFDKKKDRPQQTPADPTTTEPECSENEPKKDATPQKDCEPEITSEADCQMILDKVRTIEELDRQFGRCPRQFDHLFEPYLKKFLLEIHDIGKIDYVYYELHFDVFGELILDRYQELLPIFLANANFEAIETYYDDCPDIERFGNQFKKRYQEMLEMVDSIDELEEHYRDCPEEFNDLFGGPYQKLLHAVDLFDELEEYFSKCRGEFEPLYFGPYQKLLERVDSLDDLEDLYNRANEQFDYLFPWHYRRLLEKENFFLAELEDRLNSCPKFFDGLVLSCYHDTLQDITSLETLEERLAECSEVFEGLILEQCYDLLLSMMEGMSSQEKDELCENICDKLKPLAIAFRNRNLPI